MLWLKIKIDLLKALGDKRRLEIINTIGGKKLNVTEIAKNSSVSRSTVSHHLQILKRNRLVNSHQVGKEIYYSLNTKTIVKIAENLLNFTNQI